MNVALLALTIIGTQSSSPSSPPLASGPAPFRLTYGHSGHASEHEVAPVVNLGSLAPTPDDAEAPTPPKSKFGLKGTWRWQIQASYGIQFGNDANQFALGGAGASYFLIDDVSIDVDLNGLAFWQEGPDTGGVNFDVLFRWHLWTNEQRTWSLYADAGVGFLFTGSDVPSDGSSFNFTPQVGAGMSFDIGHDLRLLVGARWFHISNANTYRANPGRDSLQVYAQLSIPF